MNVFFFIILKKSNESVFKTQPVMKLVKNDIELFKYLKLTQKKGPRRLLILIFQIDDLFQF